MSALPKNPPSLSPETKGEKLNWYTSLPFLLAHLLPIAAFFVEFHWYYLALTVGVYYLLMFGVTAGYHRYFSHRAFKTNRVVQFGLAFLAQMSVQKGVLWWAANHRHHHKYSDQAEDIHSPSLKGFFYSHMGWVLSERYEATDYNRIKDYARFPELMWLNKFHIVPALLCVPVLFAIGGAPWLIWGGLIPLVLVWHGTFTINSLSHIFGSRRYLTTDTSRNNLMLALITCGEGWHNNHHYYQNTANQGWFWWEVDFTFYVLKAMSKLGLVSDLRLPAQQTRDSFKAYTPEQQAQLKAKVSFSAPTPTPPGQVAPRNAVTNRNLAA